MATQQNVQVSESTPGRFSVRGTLTFETAKRACEAGIRLFKKSKGPAFEVDFSEVTAADSAGLAVLLEWLRWALRDSRAMRFVNLPATIRAVARISDVEPLLEGVAARVQVAA